MSVPIALGVSVATAVVWYIARLPSTNVDGPPAPSFLTGNLLQLIAPATGRDWQLDVTKAYGGVVKIKTLFGMHSLLVSDPKALHQILVKEQDTFEEWRAFTATNYLLFGPGLVATIGQQHKKQRRMLNPVFSVKHLRGMTSTFFSIAKQLENAVLSKVANGPQEVDMTIWFNRAALEFIGQSGLGHSFGDFTEGSKNAFADAAKDLAAAVSTLVPLAIFTPYFKMLGSFGRLVVKLTPWAVLQKLAYIVNTMEDGVVNIFKAKKAALHDVDQDTGKDIMGILLKANHTSSEKDKLTDSEMIGQMATLIFTATDTTSGALARLLHQLALNPDVQTKLRQELREAFASWEGREPDYDELMALPYLDAVIRETLRVHPPIPTVFRQTMKDTVVPLSFPIRGANGQMINEVHIPKGTDILINIIGANHNTSVWGEDADQWKPSRWLSPLPNSVGCLTGVYSNMMTFLAGGRACIGFKFSELEMKVVLAILLQSLEFSLPKDKEIGWNVGLLMTPVVVGSGSIHAEMPLCVRKI